MNDILSLLVPVAMVVLLIVWAARASATQSRRRRSPLAEIIGPALLDHGLNLLSSSVPPRGNTGPFPQPSGTASHPAAYLAVGSPWQFRVVRFSTPAGGEHEAWARLFFDGNRVAQIDWHPDIDAFNGEAEQHGGQISSEGALSAPPNESSP